MTESKKGHNFAIQGPTEKKIRSLVLQPTKGVTDRQTDGQTDRPKPICPLNFFKVGGIKIAYLEL